MNCIWVEDRIIFRILLMGWASVVLAAPEDTRKLCICLQPARSKTFKFCSLWVVLGLTLLYVDAGTLCILMQWNSLAMNINTSLPHTIPAQQFPPSLSHIYLDLLDSHVFKHLCKVLTYGLLINNCLHRLAHWNVHANFCFAQQASVTLGCFQWSLPSRIEN